MFIALLVATAILGTGLRLHELAEPSLWADEMFTLRDALAPGGPGYRSTRIGLELTGVDVGAIEREAYHSFRAHGMNEWNMRIGSCALGALAIPLLGLISASFLGRPAGLILALLLAVDPWHLLWSQHARFYAPMFLFFGLALALYYSAISDPAIGRSRIKLASAMLFALLAVATKATSNLVLGIIGIDLLVETMRSRRLPLPPASLAILGVGALLCLWMTAAGLDSEDEVAGTVHFFARSLGQSPARVVAGNLFLTGLPIVIIAFVGGVGFWRTQPRLVTFLVTAVALPLAAFTALSALVHVELRYTFITTFGWLALAALGLIWFWRATQPQLGWVAACAPITLILASMAKDDLVYYESGYGNRARWHHAFDYVERHRSPGDRVITHQKWAGQFYLEDQTVQGVNLDFCPPEAGRCVNLEPSFTSLSQLQSDTWFVVKSTAFEVNEGRGHWLDDRAEMRAVYPNRIPYPQATVRVYHYRPPLDQANEGRS